MRVTNGETETGWREREGANPDHQDQPENEVRDGAFSQKAAALRLCRD